MNGLMTFVGENAWAVSGMVVSSAAVGYAHQGTVKPSRLAESIGFGL